MQLLAVIIVAVVVLAVTQQYYSDGKLVQVVARVMEVLFVAAIVIGSAASNYNCNCGNSTVVKVVEINTTRFQLYPTCVSPFQTFW